MGKSLAQEKCYIDSSPNCDMTQSPDHSLPYFPHVLGKNDNIHTCGEDSINNIDY